MLIKKIYGLIGKDIDYSFSRNYFNSKFKKLQILENEYINFDLINISDFKKTLYFEFSRYRFYSNI